MITRSTTCTSADCAPLSNCPIPCARQHGSIFSTNAHCSARQSVLSALPMAISAMRPVHVNPWCSATTAPAMYRTSNESCRASRSPTAVLARRRRLVSCTSVPSLACVPLPQMCGRHQGNLSFPHFISELFVFWATLGSRTRTSIQNMNHKQATAPDPSRASPHIRDDQMCLAGVQLLTGAVEHHPFIFGLPQLIS